MMTSQVLRVLEERALVVRAADPGDGRARMLTITKQGRALANRAVAVVEEVDESSLHLSETRRTLRTPYVS